MLTAGRVHVTTCSSLHANDTDMRPLLDFKKAISLDPHQALVSWNDSTHFCKWEGVHCRMKNPRRVITLDLSYQGLVGEISPSLGNLTFLKYLILSDNSFTAEIPPFLGNLRHLRYLSLSNNSLQGRVPSFANCSSLEGLLLNGNHLVGQIPVNWPPRLLSLHVSFNNLTGTIPTSLANLTMLIEFRCMANKIEGTIPNEFAKFRRLQFLNAGGNLLAGRFPLAILNLSTLIEVGLTANSFSGEVPPNLGNYLLNLEVLFLGINFFQGNIPPSLTNASKLYRVDIPENNFTGVVPGSIGKLRKLSMLNLELNKLRAYSKQDWVFMSSLANCTKLQIFSIEGNHLEGKVPSSLGNLSVQLKALYLGENNLSGGFPLGIANLHNLNHLSMGSNQFAGVVPEWLGRLNKLQVILLYDNKFAGFIPVSLSNLSQLGILALGSNKFRGHIPQSLGRLEMLQTLYIPNNSLHGNVPKEIFRIPAISEIDLSFNNLDGPLPIEIGNAKQLLYLVLSSNKISGNIPDTLANCESMEDIELSSNIFQGGIPTSLGNIRGLKVLNCSHNNLTGPIPMSLGNPQYLEKLDLSFNHLEGEVPRNGIFRNITAVWIGGNQGLCGGALELHLVACTVMPSNSTKHRLFTILKVVIPVASMVSIAIIIFFFWGKQEKKSMSLPSYCRQFPQVSFNDIARATNEFSMTNLIGRGGYSSVYQGKLSEDGNEIAIKVFNLEIRGAHRSFMGECNVLRNMRHRNLVHILTACSSIDSNGNDFKALVYEFMPRGDLHRLLYTTQDCESSSDLSHITLAQRVSIVVDVADALDYLHHNNQGTIVHCDLKPSNILLDDNMTAHVGDFGLARFKLDSTISSSCGSHSISSIAVDGTIGYVAPECSTGGHVSTASDVYSFGIVLLEIFLRKRPTDDMFTDGMNIAKFVEMNFPDRVSHIVDPELLQDQPVFSEETPVDMRQNNLDYLISVLKIGLSCSKLSLNKRPNMQEVAARLHKIKESNLRGN
ncbi:hypothetical protein ACQ4PT_031337 [Festuca glaucescens]